MQQPTPARRPAGPSMVRRAVAAYRRTGADLPGSDPLPTHGAEMEGWFWRFTDRARGRVVVALCGINRHPAGTWATVAVTTHPDGAQRSAVVPEGAASAERFDVRAGDVLQADARTLRVHLDGVVLDVALEDAVEWPHRVGAGGVGSVIPGLTQYWHPHLLGGRVRGSITIDGEEIVLDGADAYGEKSWGDGFPERWWWGQAQGFDDDSVCVAFGGGRVALGSVGVDLTAAVLRLGDEVVRFAPPVGWVRTSVGPGTWRVRAWRPGWSVALDGDAGGRPPAALPVPLPAERRNVVRDLEHLAGRVHLRVRHRRRLVLDDRSELGALEVGATDAREFAELAIEHGLVRP